MEYNSDNILKIEFIFHISRNKRSKKDEKVTFVLKNVPLCYFSIPFSMYLIANKRFNCINKIYEFC